MKFEPLVRDMEKSQLESLKKRIKGAKLRLRRQAKIEGISENFGKDLYTKLVEDFNPEAFTIYPIKGQVIILLNDFQKFCEEFDLSQL